MSYTGVNRYETSWYNGIAPWRQYKITPDMDEADMTNPLKVLAKRKHAVMLTREEQLWINLLGLKGGRPYVGARLSRFAAEDAVDWSGGARKDGTPVTGRLQQAHCIPYLGRIADKINQYVFGTEPVREGADDAVLDDISSDGLTINDLMADVNNLITANRWCWIKVDMPRRPDGELSQAQAEADKLRPYWTVYPSTTVVDWYINDLGDLEWLLTDEGEYVATDPTVMPQMMHIRRLWQPGMMTEYTFGPCEDGKDEEIVSAEEIPLSIDVVPFVQVGEISAAPHGFDNLESINRTIMDLESCNRQNFFNCVFPQMYMPMAFFEWMTQQGFANNAEDAVNMVKGYGYPIGVNPDDKPPGYIMPDAASIGTMRSELDSLKTALFESVGLMLRQETRQVASAEAKAWDFLDVKQVMKERSRILEDAESKAVELSKRWDSSFQEWEPKYNRDFDVSNFNADIESLVMAGNVTMPDPMTKLILRKLYEAIKKSGDGTVDQDKEKEILEAIDAFAAADVFSAIDTESEEL